MSCCMLTHVDPSDSTQFNGPKGQDGFSINSLEPFGPKELHGDPLVWLGLNIALLASPIG